MLSGVPGNLYYRDILEKLVCSVENRNCMLWECYKCPGPDALKEYFMQILVENDVDNGEEINYKQWMHTDRTTLVTMTSTVKDFV